MNLGRGSKHCEISNSCPEYISMVVEVSSCSFQKTVLSFARIWIVRIWVFEFCHNFSFWVWSQFKFLRFVAIWVVLTFVAIWVLSQYELWVLSQFEFLHFVTIWVEFCCYLSFKVLSPFEFLRFVTVWVLDFCHNLSWFLWQLEFLSFLII